MARLFIIVLLLWLWSAAACAGLDLGWQPGVQLTFSGEGEVIVVTDRGVELHRPRWQIDLFVLDRGEASGEWRVMGIFEERDLVGTRAEIREPAFGHFTASVSARGEWRDIRWTSVGRPLTPWPQIVSPPLPEAYPERPVPGGDASVWISGRELRGGFRYSPLESRRNDHRAVRRWRMTQAQGLHSADGTVDASLWSADVAWDGEMGTPSQIEMRATVTVSPLRQQMHLQSDVRLQAMTLMGENQRRTIAEQASLLSEILAARRDDASEASSSARAFAVQNAENPLGRFAAALADSLAEVEAAPATMQPAP